MTITAEEGKTIVSVKITYSPSSNGVLTFGNDRIASGTVFEVNADSVTFSVSHSGGTKSGKVFISAIEIIYA